MTWHRRINWGCLVALAGCLLFWAVVGGALLVTLTQHLHTP